MKKANLFKLMLSCVILLGSIGHSYASDWKLDKSTGNVEFYYKVGECDGQQAVLLKIVNKNEYDVQVSWREVIMDKTIGRSIESFEGEKELTLTAGKTMQASSCGDSDSSELVVFLSAVAPTHVVEMQKFEFSNIAVSVSQR
ncbi:MAG: hypothetical protein IH597_14255 [Bacteroidales bacterium]|nr:hypothetical protein [Bacteroidales bacterium]